MAASAGSRQIQPDGRVDTHSASVLLPERQQARLRLTKGLCASEGQQYIMFGLQPRRLRARGRSFLVLIIAAVIAGVLSIFYFTGHFPALPVGPGAVHGLGRTVPENVQGNEHGFLYSEGSHLFFLQPSGQERWSADVGFADITTKVSSELILNYSGPNLQVMQYSKEPLFSTSVDSPILSGAAGREYIAVLIDAPAEDSSAQQMIYLFDRNGQKSGQLSFNRQVIEFGFFSDATITDLFWTLSLDTSGAAPVSYITMYNKVNGEMTYAITISDRVIENVYVTSNQIFANGSGLLTAYTYFGEAQSNEAVQGWRPGAVVTNSTSLYAAYVPRVDSRYVEGLRTIQADASTNGVSMGTARFALPMNILGVAVTTSRVYAFSPDTVYVYTLSGSLEKTQALGADVWRIKQVSDDYVVLWGQHESYILQLQ